MKKKKKLGPLKLNKEVISELNMKEVKGGLLLSIPCTATIIIDSMLNCTRGGCDLYTVGHDDGSICFSREADWCHGR